MTGLLISGLAAWNGCLFVLLAAEQKAYRRPHFIIGLALIAAALYLAWRAGGAV